MENIPKKQTVIIVHDSFVTPESDWYPWLKQQLEQNGLRVFLPKFPTPQLQEKDEWMRVFSSYKEHIDDSTIFIGHGTGSAFLFSVLEELETPVRAAFFVSPFVKKPQHKGYAKLNASFINPEFNWKKITESAHTNVVYYSDNDPFVEGEASLHVGEILQAKIHVIKNAGHFTKAFDFHTFEPLKQEILALLKDSSSVAQKDLTDELEESGIIDLEHLERVKEDQKKTFDTKYTLKKDEGLKTYYSDMTSIMTPDNAHTMAKILQEERRKENFKEHKQKNFRKNILFITSSMLLIIVAGIVLSKFFVKPNTPQGLQERKQLMSYIPYDFEYTFPFSGISIFEIRNGLEEIIHTSDDLGTGSIQRIVFIDERNNPMDARAFFNAAESDIPAQLLDVFNDEIMYGVFHTIDDAYPFMLLSVRAFDPAFDGLRTWEVSMLSDLKDVLLIDTNDIITAVFDAPFNDKIIDNKNIRTLLGTTLVEVEETILAEEFVTEQDQKLIGGLLLEEGDGDDPADLLPTTRLVEKTVLKKVPGPEQIMLLYTFIQENLVLITTNEEVVTEVLRRLGL